jgi:hypothetical protein
MYLLFWRFARSQMTMRKWFMHCAPKLVLIASLLSCNSLLWAQQSQRPPPLAGSQPQSKTADNTHRATSEQGGTSESPIYVEQVPAPETYEEAAEHKNAEIEKASDKTLSKAFNWLLFVVGALQAIGICIQCVILRRQTGLLDKQANFSMSIERGWILVDKIDKFYVQPNPTHYDYALCHLSNFGKTPSKLMNLRYELQIGDTIEFPPDPSIFKEEVPRVDRRMLPPGKEIRLEVKHKDFLIPPEVKESIKVGKQFIWVCGYVRYFDAYGRGPYRTNFCEIYQPRSIDGAPRFSAAGPDEYNQAT